MKTNVVGYQSGTLTGTTDRFMEAMSHAHPAQTTASQSASTLPCAGTCSKLYIVCDAGPGVGLTRDFELYKNGVNTGVKVTLSGTTATGSDLSNSVAVVAGDRLALRTSASGTTTSTGIIRWGFLFDAATSISPICNAAGVALSASATNYLTIMGSRNPDATAANHTLTMPCAGTLKNLYVTLNGAAAPGSYAVTLYVNGSPTSLTCSTGAGATGNDTTHSVSVSAGDTVYYEIVPTSTPTTRFPMCGVEFDPTVDGEAPLMFMTTTTTSTSAVRFNTVEGIAVAWSGTEAPVQEVIAAAAVMKKLYVVLSAAPGAAKSYRTQLSVNAAAGNPDVTITGAGTTTGNDTANTAAVAAGALIATKVTPSSTPTAAAFTWSIVSYIANGVSGTGTITAATGVTGTESTARSGAAAAITSATTCTGTRATNRTGTASLTAATAVTGTRLAARFGTGAITAVTAVTGTGSTTRAGVGVVTAVTAVTSTGSTTRSGTTAISAATAVTQSSTNNRSGTSGVTCATGSTGSGAAARRGTATVTATSAVTAAGINGEGHSGTGTITQPTLVTGEGFHGAISPTAITAATATNGTGGGQRAGAGTCPTTVPFIVTGTTQRFGNSTTTIGWTFVVSGVSAITGEPLEVKEPTSAIVPAAAARRGAELTGSGVQSVIPTP